MADEIVQACDRGDLECHPQLVAEMPPFTWSQLKVLPGLYIAAFESALMLAPPVGVGPSSGDDPTFAVWLEFLHHPRYSRRETQERTSFTIRGWYRRSGTDWINVTATDWLGPVDDLSFERETSPDLAAIAPEWTNQRFTLRFRCGGRCVLRIETPGGAAIEKSLGEIMERAPLPYEVGGGMLFVDSALSSDATGSALRQAEKVAARLRSLVLMYYGYALVPLLILGALGFILSSSLYWRRAAGNICHLIALTCWTFVVARLTVLVLVTATSFDSLRGFYHGPACTFLAAAAVMSIAAFLQLSGYLAAPTADAADHDLASQPASSSTLIGLERPSGRLAPGSG